MAHELTHVINRDVMVMTIASFFATIASLHRAVRLLLRRRLRRRRRATTTAPDRRVILVSVAVYAISFLLLQALSRYREFAADRGSAVITGRPSALASALLKISGADGARAPAGPARRRASMNAFFIIPAEHEDARWPNLFSTTRRSRSASRRSSASRPSCRDRAAGRRVAARGPPRRSSPGAAKLKGPAPDRLFAISTAYVTFETALNLKTRGGRRIVFQPLETADFDAIVTDMEEVVRGTGADDRARRSRRDDDSYGYRWMILRDPGLRRPRRSGVNAVSGAIEVGGYGERVLCAVFAFEDASAASRSTGSTTTSAGSSTRSSRAGGEQQRDTERELRLKAQVGRGAAGRARARALVPALGHPDLTPAPARRRRRAPSVRDQPVAGELLGRLREGDVGRRQDHVGRLELVVGERGVRRSRTSSSIWPSRSRKPASSPASTACHDLVVELVQARRRRSSGEAVLALARDADDHVPAASPWPCRPSGRASPPPEPSSAFILASSSSTAPALRELARAGGRCRPRPSRAA